MAAALGTEVYLGTVGKGPGGRTETNGHKQMSPNNEKTKGTLTGVMGVTMYRCL